MHIRCDKCTRRSRSELIHGPAVKDQQDCVLNDLEELGDNEFRVLTDQYNVEIFLRLLLEVDHHDEEEYSIVLTLDKRWANKFLAQYQSNVFPRWVQFL